MSTDSLARDELRTCFFFLTESTMPFTNLQPFQKAVIALIVDFLAVSQNQHCGTKKNKLI